ncbi:MAG: HAMP domain-containing histidine kinase, partial [Muribaculaceae bacterium]|nr:HAMP domain-containing histidine kinase [Muribaculaceae bacterium]
LPEIIIGSFACITERKEQVRRLIEARESAKEADRLKSAFLANMSHEIRTPLNAIVGFSNMLAETDDPELKQKFIGIIESNNDMLLQIISDILDLSKTEAGTMEFNMRPTDVNALLENIGESVVDRVKPGVDLLCNLGAQCCWIDTDPNRLSQVVANFLTNASKFTETGNITFGYEVRGEMLYFYCHDTGSGISDENQKKVFERFIKLNSFVNGTGLGLPICKAIVEFLGGKIGVYSEGEGCGSTFWFEIPYRAVAVPDDVEPIIWTEPTINLTLQHELSMPEHHDEMAHEHHEHHEHHEVHGGSYSQADVVEDDIPLNEEGQHYDSQIGPDGMPMYPPQMGPDGMPMYPPQLGPDGIPMETLHFEDQSELQVTADMLNQSEYPSEHTEISEISEKSESSNNSESSDNSELSNNSESSDNSELSEN